MSPLRIPINLSNNKAWLSLVLFIFGGFFLLLSLQEVWYERSVKLQGVVLEKSVAYEPRGSGAKTSERNTRQLRYQFTTPQGEIREDWGSVLTGNFNKFSVGGPVDIEYQPATRDSRVSGQTASARTYLLIGIGLLTGGWALKRFKLSRRAA